MCVDAADRHVKSSMFHSDVIVTHIFSLKTLVYIVHDRITVSILFFPLGMHGTSREDSVISSGSDKSSKV